MLERSRWIARFVLPHEPAMRRFLAPHRLPASLDVDDVIQEIYGRIAEMAEVDTIRDPRFFLLGMARNIVRQHHRRSRIVSIQYADDLAAFDVPTSEPSPADEVSDRQQLHMLALAIGELGEPLRSIFLLRAIDELSHREIGARLGMSDNAVQKAFAKTLHRLAQLLGRGGNHTAKATSQRHSQKSEHDDRARDER